MKQVGGEGTIEITVRNLRQKFSLCNSTSSIFCLLLNLISEVIRSSGACFEALIAAAVKFLKWSFTILFTHFNPSKISYSHVEVFLHRCIDEPFPVMNKCDFPGRDCSICKLRTLFAVMWFALKSMDFWNFCVSDLGLRVAPKMV